MFVSLYLDTINGKIKGYNETVNQFDIAAEVNDLSVFGEAKKKGKDLYFENGKIVEKDAYSDEKAAVGERLGKELSRLKEERREILSSAVCGAGKSRDIYEEADKVYDKILRVEKQLKDLRLERKRQAQSRLMREISETDYKYYCSICLIIRDENEYLQEWLEWHISQGIEHFYIYDHGSKQSVKEFLKTLDKSVSDKVTVTDFGGRHNLAQYEAYNDCLRRFQKESRWIGFIDSDEFVNVKGGKSMRELLKDYEAYAGVFARWVVYNANGLKEKTDAPCRERFTSVYKGIESRDMGKIFVQSALISYMMIHNGYTKAELEVVDEHKRPLSDGGLLVENATTDFICINHYYTKSYEEWVEKISRGSCDPFYSRKYDEFFDYNPDMEYCREEIFPVQEYEVSKK